MLQQATNFPGSIFLGIIIPACLLRDHIMKANLAAAFENHEQYMIFFNRSYNARFLVIQAGVFKYIDDGIRTSMYEPFNKM